MPTILIIDDNASLRTLFRAILELNGYRVEEASNGREGLTVYQRERADLVLCDQFMPELDGLGTLRQLQQLDPEVKVVAMSGGSLCIPGNFLDMANLLGAAATLHKPFSKEALLAAVRRALAA